jgi:FlaA1/EpsC-like NDP-sugar epimerase
LRIKVSKICLSTDKAAYPINAMGISKRWWKSSCGCF